MEESAMKSSPSSSPARKRVKLEVAAVDEFVDIEDDIIERAYILILKRFSALCSLYQCTFIPTMTIPDCIKQFTNIDPESPLDNVHISLSGMIVKKQISSERLFFYDLRSLDPKFKVTVHVTADARNSCMGEAEFSRFHSSLKRGTIIGISGFPGKSERGELSIFPKSYAVLSLLPREKAASGTDMVDKCTGTLPLKSYLDIMRNKEVRQIFVTRYSIADYIAKFLNNHSFLQVQTPMMSTIAGGVAGRPFLPLTNELSYVCRFSVEIWFHQLLRGCEHVYDIGKQGTDMTHVPEFTACEFYMDFDYNNLMELTEQILSGMVKDQTGGYKIKCHANGLDRDLIEIDFTPPFRRISMIEELEKRANLNIPKDFSSDVTNKYLIGACAKFDIECPHPHTTALLLEKLMQHFLGDECVNPTFIIDYPKIMRFAKCHRLKPGLTESFELFINKHEVCNGYAALNESVAYSERFSEQLKNCQSCYDEELVLEYGLSPTGGWGLGVDRLTMLLINSQKIEEVGSSCKMNHLEKKGADKVVEALVGSSSIHVMK